MTPDQSGGTITRAAVTIGLILSLIGCVMGGFFYSVVLQSDLSAIEARSRAKTIVRSALFQANSAITSALAAEDRRPDLSSYNLALSKLARQADSGLPAVVKLEGSTVSTTTVVEALTSAWTEIIPAIHRGSFDAGKEILLGRDLTSKMDAVAVALAEGIDALAAARDQVQARYDLMVRLLLALQVLKGTLCIGAFVLATRRGRREAAARVSAITSAHASREQTMRLFEMTDMLQSANDHQDANAVLRATALELLPDFGGALYVFNNSNDRLILSTSWNRAGAAELPDSIGLQQCWSLKRGKSHINVPGSHRLACEHFDGDDCVLEIPMAARGEILGLLQLHASGDNGEARLAHIGSLGQALADGMSLALANIGLRDKLRGQALRDPLTGLYNRRYMEDALLRLSGLAEREKQELAIVMIDLDHFKRLNDNYGHAKGDAVLRDAAAVLLNQIRETDIACRYGGEELIVVLPNCSLQMAMSKAERMRTAIEALSEPNGAQVSASMGVAAIPSTSVTPRDMLATADAALYQAKQEGRNRVVSAERRRDAPTQRVEPTFELVAAE